MPTWNYAVVHVHGQPSFIEDRDWLHAHVGRLTGEHEAKQADPWQVEDAPADFTEALLRAIVGVEIRIQRIEGKWKTSQNRPQSATGRAWWTGCSARATHTLRPWRHSYSKRHSRSQLIVMALAIAGRNND